MRFHVWLMVSELERVYLSGQGRGGGHREDSGALGRCVISLKKEHSECWETVRLLG